MRRTTPNSARPSPGASERESLRGHTRLFADGVSPVTATLPAGWAHRLVPIRNANTRNATGWRLEVHDIAIAKYAAKRGKDHRYKRALWRHGLIEARTFEECPGATSIEEKRRPLIRSATRRHREETRRDWPAGARTEPPPGHGES